MRASSPWSTVPTASRSAWDGAPAASRRRYTARWRAATADAAFPVARHPRLHGHHVKHWADGGGTSLDNLILLCPTHHRLVHEGGFDVQRLDDGVLRFTNPHGLTIRPPRRRALRTTEDGVNERDREVGGKELVRKLERPKGNRAEYRTDNLFKR